jgi:hypothetical protein
LKYLFSISEPTRPLFRDRRRGRKEEEGNKKEGRNNYIHKRDSEQRPWKV